MPPVAATDKKESTIAVAGMTSTLFGRDSSTADYYGKISELADRVLELDPDVKGVIATLERASGKKRFLKKAARSDRPRQSLARFILSSAREILAPHTTLVQAISGSYRSSNAGTPCSSPPRSSTTSTCF